MNSIILGIIKHFKGDYYLEVKEYLQGKEGIEKEEEKETSEAIIFDFLADKFKEESTILTLYNKEILQSLYLDLGVSEEDAKRDFKIPKAKTINTILKDYGLIKSKENIKRTSKGMCYTIKKSDFIDMLGRLGYKRIADKLHSFSSFPAYSTQNNEENEDYEENELRSTPDRLNKNKR